MSKKPKWDECYTPKYIFDALGVEFDLDPCSPEVGGVVPAQHRYHLPGDGLSVNWFGFVWVNPPYSKPAPWVEKWLNHGNGLLMVLTTKSKWYKALWDDERTVTVNLHPPKFDVLNSTPRQIAWPVNIWAIGEQAQTVLRNSKLGKIR